MLRHLDAELQELKALILQMGGCVEKAIEQVALGVFRGEPERFKEVHRQEIQIDELHIQVDQACLKFLAKQAPVAKDLRLVLAVTKINTDLERMGDQASNIAFCGEDYIKRHARPIFVKELTEMTKEVQYMVKASLDAFVRRDVELSRQVLERDDTVDAFKEKIFNGLKQKMAEDNTQIDACMDLILIARNLERLADHATNIAEEVIFLATGDDIRHGHREGG